MPLLAASLGLLVALLSLLVAVLSLLVTSGPQAWAAEKPAIFRDFSEFIKVLQKFRIFLKFSKFWPLDFWI